LRVGIRRMRSTLRAFRELLQRDPARRFDGELRSVLRSLGAARDWDVLAAEHPEIARLSGARAGRARARRAVRAMLASDRVVVLARAVLAWARTRPWRERADPAEAMASFGERALERLRRRLLELAEDVDWQDGERRHRIRIRVKRLRYGCDCFAAAWQGKAPERFHRRLHQLQNVLGELNDIQVQGRLLGELARSGGGSAAIASARGALRARERKLAARLPRAWKAFEKLRPYWRRGRAVRA
jgi:CHAD domain-containing protein